MYILEVLLKLNLNPVVYPFPIVLLFKSVYSSHDNVMQDTMVYQTATRPHQRVEYSQRLSRTGRRPVAFSIYVLSGACRDIAAGAVSVGRRRALRLFVLVLFRAPASCQNHNEVSSYALIFSPIEAATCPVKFEAAPLLKTQFYKKRKRM